MRNDAAPPENGGVPEHPGRLRLAAEVHARPPMRLAAPAKVSHLVMLSGEDAAADERAHLALLCDSLDVAQPDHEARQYFADFGAFKLRWERHTEFASWTFVREGAVAAATFDRPFGDLPIRHVPGEWLSALPGEALVRVELALLPREVAPPRHDQIDGLFEHAVGGLVGDGTAQVWTDFRPYDGATHILVHDLALTHGRRGRLVQRLIEIETYRMLALLAFPLALAHAPEVTAIDRRLADLTQRLRRAEAADAQRALLDEALALGAEIERIANATSYRFSAARAYYELVERRIEELREQRVPNEEPGAQQLGQFVRRRLTPAMRTCESVRERLETASRHLSRTANLLRSRIELDLAEQNRAQLAVMNRRGRLQLRLQRTVEGLSVAAISYYVVGLFAVVYEALPAAARPVEAGVATGLSVPVVVLLAWHLIRRLRRGIAGRRTPE
jgi:uncharacterized membrane-anchored protein